MEKNDVAGIIYTLKEHNYYYMKKRKSPVYIKYTPHADSKNPTKLDSGHILFFYISGKEKSIIGYSKINDISFHLPKEIKQNYIDRIQMKEDEFNKYINHRESKSLLALELDKIIDLPNSIPITYPITMGGKYLSSMEVKNFIGDHLNIK
jgi:hypothetical protein